MNILTKIKEFFVKKNSKRPQTFIQYILYYPLNWMCAFGCLLFIGIFLEGGQRYQSPLLYNAALFPLLMIIYNFIDEYFAFQFYITGHRKVTVKTMINIGKIVFSIAMLYLILRTFIFN